MPGRHAKAEPKTFVLQAYDENAQGLMRKLDEMKAHAAKCSRCRYIPVARGEERPCPYMTAMAIWASGFWANLTRQSPMVQDALFGVSEVR